MGLIAASFGKLLGRAVDASRLWSRAPGRVRQRDARAKKQVGGDGWSIAGEGEGQDLARTQLGWAAHTRLSRSEGTQDTAPARLQQRGEMQSCSAGIDKALFER